MEVNIPISKDKIAIVVVGYNRLKSITRLLDSLAQAKYPLGGVPLVISIDCSGDDKLYQFVREFQWPYGDKYVNIQSVRLGLKNHIYQCGNLTKYFKAIILLEDDLYVSPYFYKYVEKTIEKYGDNPQIAEISLYKNESNGYVGLPFENMQTGSDVFLMQDVSTWGQCWTEQMWDGFKKWKDSHSEEYVLSVDMPSTIKNWTRAWSKYYNAYVVDSRKYVLYPNIALTTNFSDAGEHGGDNNSVVQTNLLQGNIEYRLPEVSKLTRYDIYFNNESIFSWLNMTEDELCLDIYGFHENNNKRFLLTTKKLPYNAIRTFALNMRPIELNVKYQISGTGLYLYDTQIKDVLPREKAEGFIAYMLKGFNPRMLLSYLYYHYKTLFLKKLK